MKKRGLKMFQKKATVYSLLLTSFLFFHPEINADERFLKEAKLKAINYEIDYFVDFDAKNIKSSCRLVVQNSSEEPVLKIPFLLYKDFSASSVRGENGRSIPFTQKKTSFEDWEKFIVNYVEIALKEPLQPGVKKTLEITYNGTLSGYTETGLKYVKDHISREFTFIREECKTYPIVCYPSLASLRKAVLNSRFDYLINVSVPAGLKVANGGYFIGKTSKDGLDTFTYRNSRPAWRIDIAIGDYGVLRDVNNNFQVFYFKEDFEGAKVIIKAMKNAIDLLSVKLGPLKGKENTLLSVIEIPAGYGPQNDTTVITMDEFAFKDDANVSGLYHEIAHWWNVPPLDPEPCRMESEGFAMFIEGWVDNQLKNKDLDLKGDYERARDSFLRSSERNPKALTVPLIDYGKERITNFSYGKGNLVFKLLYALLGEESFFHILGEFYSNYHERGATTTEFVDYVKTKAEIDLARFFDEWIFGIESNQYLKDKVPFEEIIKKYKR